MTAKQIESWTQKDLTLSTVLQYVRSGWPDRCDDDHYYLRRGELSVYQGCLLWGARVIIPPKNWEAFLVKFHEGHSGMTRMKALARMYVWWPGMEKDIEAKVNLCTRCQMLQPAPPVAPLQPWKWLVS